MKLRYAVAVPTIVNFDKFPPPQGVLIIREIRVIRGKKKEKMNGNGRKRKVEVENVVTLSLDRETPCLSDEDGKSRGSHL